MTPTPSSTPVGSDVPAPAATPAPTALRRTPLPLRPLLAVAHFVRHNPGRSLAVVCLLVLIGLGLTTGGSQLWASYHYRAARTALGRYHNSEAVEHLDACMRIWPNDPDVLILAARAARRSGRFDGAENFLDRYQRRRGSTDELVLERVLVTAERGDVDSVSRFCRARVDANGADSPLVLEAMTRGFLRRFRIDQATVVVGVWEERDPDNTMALLLRGRIAQEREADPDAAAAFRRALELDPEMDEARDRLTMVLLRMHQPNEALKHLEYLFKRRQDDPGVAVRLAECRDLLGQQDEAARLLDDVLARHPSYVPALAERGKLALRQGEWAEAEPRLRKAVSLAPGDAHLLPHFRQCLEQLGKDEEARALVPRIKKAEDDLARLRRLLDRDLQDRPEDADLWYEVGMILVPAGSVAEGVNCLENAVRFNPRHVRAHEALADIYRRVGDAARAAAEQKLAREAGAPAEKEGGLR
jgi:Flp pilus assembly protein TadD